MTDVQLCTHELIKLSKTGGLHANATERWNFKDILQRPRKTYGRENIQKIEANLLHLNNPMDRNLPVEVMITDVEDVQLFLLANPAENM